MILNLSKRELKRFLRLYIFSQLRSIQCHLSTENIQLSIGIELWSSSNDKCLWSGLRDCFAIQPPVEEIFKIILKSNGPGRFSKLEPILSKLSLQCSLSKRLTCQITNVPFRNKWDKDYHYKLTLITLELVGFTKPGIQSFEGVDATLFAWRERIFIESGLLDILVASWHRSSQLFQ